MRKITPATILLPLWGVFLAIAVALYLEYLQPARLGVTVAEALQSSLPVDCSIEQVDFTLAPLPGVLITGLELTGQTEGTFSLRLEHCRAELSWLSLFQGQPVLSSLELMAPSLSIHLPTPEAQPSNTEKTQPVALSANSGPLPSLPSSLAGVNISVHQGAAEIFQGTTRISLDRVDGTIELPGLFSGKAELGIGRATLQQPGVPRLEVSNLTLASDNWKKYENSVFAALELKAGLQGSSLEEALGRKIAPEYNYLPLPEPAKAGLTLEVQVWPMQQRFAIAGNAFLHALVPVNGHNTLIKLDTPFAVNQPGILELPGLNLTMGDDKLVFYGKLSGLDGDGKASPELRGETTLVHFSLPRWFDFARKMNGALQKALDNISGSFSIVLNGQGLSAPRLQATTLGYTFTGMAELKSFAAPFLLIDLSCPAVNLDPAFPELLGKPGEEPDLPPPAIINENNGKPPPLGFDIRLGAEKVTYWKLKAGKAQTSIIPNNGKGVFLDATVDDLYGGKGQARVLIWDENSIKGKLSGVNLETPVKDISGLAAVGGKMDATVDCSFSGKTGLEMLGSLEATLDASTGAGYVYNKEKGSLPVTGLRLKAKVKGPGKLEGNALPPRIDFTGTWEGDFHTAKLDVNGTTNATIGFSSTTALPVFMKPQMVRYITRLDKSFTDGEDLKLNIQGLTSFNFEAGEIKLEKFSAETPGLVASGSLVVTGLGAQHELSGKITLGSAALPSIAKIWGFALPEARGPQAWREFTLETTMRQSGDLLELKDINARLDQQKMSGKLAWKGGERPHWNINLHAEAFNADPYLPPPGTKKNSPIPVDLVAKTDGQLELSAGRFTLYNTPLSNVRLAGNQQKGILSLPEINAAFPGGGTIKGKGSVRVEKSSLRAEAQFDMQNVNMQEFSISRGQKTIVAGTGQGSLTTQALLSTWEDIPRKLDGRWAFQITSGFVGSAKQAQANTSGSVPPGRTMFRSLGASGSLLGGVLQSGDFLLEGNSLKVTGQGSINLNSYTIDAKAVATLLGVPEMPITVSGSLDDPKTSYQIVGAVAGTIGNLGGTVLDVIGGVLTAPFKLFNLSPRKTTP